MISASQIRFEDARETSKYENKKSVPDIVIHEIFTVKEIFGSSETSFDEIGFLSLCVLEGVTGPFAQKSVIRFLTNVSID